MRRYLAREDLSFFRRLRVAASRMGETEDDELAFAFHCTNDAPGIRYEHGRCAAAYMGRAMGVYRYRHIERGMGMVFKAVGLAPRGRLSGVAARGAWQLLCWRRNRFRATLSRMPQHRPVLPRPA